MRWTTAAVTVAVLLLGTTACSDAPEDRTAAGVPQRWYAAVSKAVQDQPGVTSVALLDDGGPCPLRDEAVLDGEEVDRVLDHGVVRLGDDIPTVICDWYEGTPVQVLVAQALDDGRYAALVDGTTPDLTAGNEQTGREVTVGGRTVQVVRTTYPTNPSAGAQLTANLLDEGSRGRVSLQVDSADEIDGYDEQDVAEDLVAFVDG